MHACDIVAEALEIDAPAQRAEYVEKTCGTDGALRERVLAMLQFHAENSAFLGEDTFAHSLVGERTGEALGSVIGNYKLLDEIGEGGFGTVYLADQTTPVNRKVALKIIKLGMDTRQVVARFEAERQALAMMDHPSIAHVLDAGATASGRPYFVMELVKGISITEFCDQNRMTIRQRLELFVEVCQAVQHAHQKGIIHRDLKPSNILVTLKGDKPLPKVIDFGVAKAINQRLTEQTLFTHFGQMIGTPQYMSPEQAQMSAFDVDTRSDVYTLGVVLFEVLTGEPPVSATRLRTAGFDEMRRIIVEEEPPTPSSRVSTLSEQSARISDCRAVETGKLGQLYRGDLDWIVMKTLSKDPDQRYSSASALAADVKRHLADEPVLASPPSSVYRLRKFIRRNRALVLGAATTMAGFLAGLAFTIFALMQTVSAKSEAEVTIALLKNLIARSDPDLGKSPDYRVSEMLDDFSSDLPDLSDKPRVELELSLILGQAYEQLSLNETTAVHLLRAIELQRQLYGNDDLRVAETLSNLAWISIDTGRFPRSALQAQQYSQEGIEICRRLNDASETMVSAHGANSLALVQLDQPSEAEQVLQDALDALRRSGEVVDETRMPLEFARVRLAQGRPAEALKLIRAAIVEKEKQGAEIPRDELAYCYYALGDFEKADREYLSILESSRKAFGSYTFKERRAYKIRADMLREQGRHAEAAQWLDKGRDAMNKNVLAWLLPDWAVVHLDLGHYDVVNDYCSRLLSELTGDSEELNTRIIAHTIRETTLEVTNPQAVKDVAIANRADMEKAIAIWHDDYGVNQMYASNLLRAYPDDDEALRKAIAAASLSVDQIRQAKRSDREDFRGTVSYHALARAKAAAGDFRWAIQLELEALKLLSPDHWLLRGLYNKSLVKYYVADDRDDEARKVLTEAVSTTEEAELAPELQFQRARAELDLAEFLLQHGERDEVDEAERLIEKANTMLDESKFPGGFYRQRAQRLLKECQAKRAAVAR